MFSKIAIYMSEFMKTVPKNWNRALSGRFFPARNSLQRWRYKNYKESQSFFPSFTRLSSFHCRRFCISLPVNMAWRRPKSLVKSRWRVIRVEIFSTVFINPDIYRFASIYIVVQADLKPKHLLLLRTWIQIPGWNTSLCLSNCANLAREPNRLHEHNTYGIEIKPWPYRLASSCKRSSHKLNLPRSSLALGGQNGLERFLANTRRS